MIATTGGARRLATLVAGLVLGAVALTGCLTTPGDLAGTVRDTTSAPVGGLTVTVYDGAGAVVDSTTSDASGAYGFPALAPRYDYRLGISDPGGTYLDWWHGGASGLATATPIAVGDGATTTVDAVVVTPATAGSVGGTVTDVSSAPLGGITVQLLGTDSANPLASTSTAGDGTYILGNLSPGSYRVRFVDPAGVLAPEFAGDQPSFGLADAVVVSAGSTSGASASLAVGGTIEITVVTGGYNLNFGPPIPDIRVGAFVVGDLEHPVATGVSDANGVVDVGQIPAGSYYMVFFDAENVVTGRSFAPNVNGQPRVSDLGPIQPMDVPDGGGAFEGFAIMTGLDCVDEVFDYNRGDVGDLSGADLSGARLAGCNVYLRTIEDADFSGADLRRSRFSANASRADLSAVNFTDSRIQGTFDDATLAGSDLRRSDLSGFPIGMIVIHNSFVGTDFSDALLTGATFGTEDLSAAIWSNTTCPDGTNSDDAIDGTCLAHLVG